MDKYLKTTETEELWAKFLPLIRKKINKQSFETWITPLRLASFKENTLVINTPSSFFIDWLKRHYLCLIRAAFSELTGLSEEELTLRFISESGAKENLFSAPVKDKEKKTRPQKNHIGSSLNPRYNFENFVVGSSNQFAHAACLAVAEAPARAYNPLFIYGGVGLGKTHLMQAIGQFICNKNQNAKVVYCSTESFTNQLIDAIQRRETLKFRNKYRVVDALLIDDIHFLAHKESTQEEFFHTFNTLYDARKQIVVSSDRPPKEISTLEERLVSRFGWGLVTDIQPPNLETRIAILKRKMMGNSVQVPEEVIMLIASRVKVNIRELEGALIRVSAYASISGENVTIELTEKVLSDIHPQERVKQITLDLIKKQVANYFDLRVLDMEKKSRARVYALPRQIAMYLARELTSFSLPQIGETFGGRHHTTILHAHCKLKNEIKSNVNLKKIIEDLIQTIKE